MLEVKSIRKSFGSTPALSGISFGAHLGEITGLLGPNGAGKSTSMKIISGRLMADTGEVLIDGASATADAVGYLPEGAPLFEDLSARKHLEVMASLGGLTPSVCRRRLEEIAAELEMSHILDRPIQSLSKGYKRRVALAVTLMRQVKLLLLDEPTDGLDPSQRVGVRKTLKKAAQTSAILVSTHSLEDVRELCDTLVFIKDGEVSFTGTPAEMAEKHGKGNLDKAVIALSTRTKGKAA